MAATCDRITVDAGAPAWIMVYVAPVGLVTPSEDQVRITDADAPDGTVSVVLPGDGPYVYDVSVTYPDTVEDTSGVATC